MLTNKYGIFKPGSLIYDPINEIYNFVITNWREEVNIQYKSNLPFEFKEGDKIIITGHFLSHIGK